MAFMFIARAEECQGRGSAAEGTKLKPIEVKVS